MEQINDVQNLGVEQINVVPRHHSNGGADGGIGGGERRSGSGDGGAVARGEVGLGLGFEKVKDGIIGNRW